MNSVPLAGLAALPSDSPENDRLGDVLVVGGGISGIQASLDLAETGFRVYLVDKSPAIGGKMSQLDKTFPTNDCSMCIESPKFIECSRHPNVDILTNTEVVRVEGEAGNFRVTLNRKPRYVNEDICTGCTTCFEYCPVQVPDPYNQNLSLTKAVHIHFSQAVPLVSYIDPETCLYLQDEKCNICVGVCENHAIDLHQKPEKLELEVGAVVLSPGYEVFDPAVRGDYGYGKMKNVVTSLEFERILSATGPYEGEIRRPSDGKHPERIAWIQCVGSRQVIPGGNTYCSAVCCAYTQKQVILAKDHYADIDATVFHNDIRAFGKDFERYYQRAENLPGVRFIRSYVSVGREIPESKNVTIRYATDGDGVKEEEFDLVVLSVGLSPPKDAADLANKFGIELNSHGFCKTNPLNPIETSRPGIFVSGAFQGPADIPESVVSASGAAALCGQLLASQRGKLSQRAGISAGAGCFGRGTEGGGFCLPLRSEYRQSGQCSFSRRICLQAEKRRSRPGKPVCLFHGQCPADRGHDPRQGAQPRGHRRLYAEDPRTLVPGHGAGRRNQSVFLRHGEYPGALRLGALPGKGRCHPEGKGNRPDVGGPDHPAAAFAGNRAAGQQGGPGHRRRAGRDDQRPEHGRAGIRGLSAGKGRRPGRYGAQDSLHPRRSGCPGVSGRAYPQGLPASLDTRRDRFDHQGGIRLRGEFHDQGAIGRKGRGRYATAQSSSLPVPKNTNRPNTSTEKTSGY